jgi:hypothetical protein
MFSVVLPVAPVTADDGIDNAEPAVFTASRDSGGKGDSNSDFTDS